MLDADLESDYLELVCEFLADRRHSTDDHKVIIDLLEAGVDLDKLEITL